MPFERPVLLGAILLVLHLRPAGAAEPAAFLQQHCTSCHGAEEPAGKLRLDDLTPDLATPPAAQRWSRVYSQLVRRQMPPPTEPQPSSADRQNLLAWLAPRVRDAAAARRSADGRVELRRLNRVEYQNTIRDLLGVQTNVAELLPEDGSAHGFDKVSSALTLSPVQIDKYLEAADLALDAAIGIGQQPRFVQQRYPATDLIAGWEQRGQRKLEGGGLVIFNSGYSPTELRKFRAPAAGSYRVRVSVFGFQSPDAPVIFRLYGGNFNNGGKTKLLGHFSAPSDKPQIVELTAHLESRGDTLKLMPYGTINWQNKADEYTGPGVAVEWLEVEGPLEGKEWPPATRRQLLGDADWQSGSSDDARRVITSFAARAFRRPVSDEDVAPYVALTLDRLSGGAKFPEALRVGLKAVLVSPRFLLLQEQPGPLDDYALASRLSYFLWSTMPDAELLAAAERGDLASGDKLRRDKLRSDQLRSQVERMLNDPKAEAFIADFTGQWLGLRNIEFTTPDSRLYPEFDELLQVSMVAETRAFFGELLARDRSVLNFIDSDFAMLNERLAGHYGIPGVRGLDMRPVPLQPDWHRGGVLTQASVLKVTANGTTTSPVTRGAWLANRLLGRPVPPPPAGVPAVEPDIRGAKTIRDQLAKHRETESCAACHARMDPLGFALENYDVIGGWREKYRVTPDPRERNRFQQITLTINTQPRRLLLGPAVDARDTLADGRHFRNLVELKQLLLADPDQLARAVAEKLIIYATGEGLDAADDVDVSEIVQAAKARDYGLRSLVHAVIASPTFQHK